LKELELTAGRATRISAVLKSLEDNWSPLPKFNTDEDRSFFEIALLFVKQWLEVQLKS
jgi:ATP-dependent DNA helicase RecG